MRGAREHRLTQFHVTSIINAKWENIFITPAETLLKAPLSGDFKMLQLIRVILEALKCERKQTVARPLFAPQTPLLRHYLERHHGGNRLDPTKCHPAAVNKPELTSHTNVEMTTSPQRAGVGMSFEWRLRSLCDYTNTLFQMETVADCRSSRCTDKDFAVSTADNDARLRPNQHHGQRQAPRRHDLQDTLTSHLKRQRRSLVAPGKAAATD